MDTADTLIDTCEIISKEALYLSTDSIMNYNNTVIILLLIKYTLDNRLRDDWYWPLKDNRVTEKRRPKQYSNKAMGNHATDIELLEAWKYLQEGACH